MASPSQIRAAQAAGNRAERVRRMAEVMRRGEASHGACTYADLCAAGFAEAEIEAYRDDARREIAGLLPAGFTATPGRIEGNRLVAAAEAIRARNTARWAPPVIEPTGARA